MQRLLRPVPDLRERVWGGRRLGPPGRQPIGEAWLAGPDSIVADGPDAGRSLSDLAARDGAALVGSRATRRTGNRFPLLVKLLDPAAWLSVQVHPDDATARRLEGPDAVGKTEAWFVVDAEPGAEVLLGVRDGVDEATVRAAIASVGRGGAGVAALLAHRRAIPGTAFFVPAGALHAVGPGLLAYELQQASDITYRCEDWGRPATAHRPLHIEQSLASLALDRRPLEVAPTLEPRVDLIACEHFVMERVNLEAGGRADFAPAGRSPHIVTALAPVRLEIEAAGGQGGEATTLAARETIVVPASVAGYAISAISRATVLVARVS